MIDESFGRVTNAIRPPGRSIVTSELSIDLVDMTGNGSAWLSCQANVIAVLPDAALVHSALEGDHGAIVATASTWCRFMPGGHDEDLPYPQAAKPPADLALNQLLTIARRDEDQIVTARFIPDDRCANDHGTLHGGIAAAAGLEVGLAWLGMIYPHPSASSIRINLLRPGQLNQPLDIEASPIHIGRSIAVTRVVSRNPAGKPTTIATVTGTPSPSDGSRSPADTGRSTKQSIDSQIGPV